MNLRTDTRSATLLLTATLFMTMGCATQRYDAHGNPYYEPTDHTHATEGAILGGIAGAGVGRMIAGHQNDEAGYWLGGALGAITGAVIGDSIDRQEAAHRYPDVPPPSSSRHDDYEYEDDRAYDRDRDDRYDDRDRNDRYDRDDDYDDWEDTARDRQRGSEPTILNLPDEVLFAEGSTELARGAERRLRTVALALRRHPGTQAVIRGHASGAENRRPALADARARVVREYLLHHGVAPSRVTALGMGDRFPVASDRSAEGRQRNRRAEIEIHTDRGHELARLW